MNLSPRIGVFLAVGLCALGASSPVFAAGEAPVLEYLQIPALLASDLDSSSQPGSLRGQLIVGHADLVGTSVSASTGVTAHFGVARFAPVTVPEPALNALQPVALIALAALFRANARRTRRDAPTRIRVGGVSRRNRMRGSRCPAARGFPFP